MKSVNRIFNLPDIFMQLSDLCDYSFTTLYIANLVCNISTRLRHCTNIGKKIRNFNVCLYSTLYSQIFNSTQLCFPDFLPKKINI